MRPEALLDKRERSHNVKEQNLVGVQITLPWNTLAPRVILHYYTEDKLPTPHQLERKLRYEQFLGN